MAVEDLLVRLIGDGISYRKMLDSANKQAARFEKTIGKASQKIANMGKVATSVGKKLSVGLTLPMVGLGAAAIKAGDSFNRGLANLATLGLAQDRVKELGTDIRELSVSVGKSTSDITEGAYQVVSAFGDTAETIKLVEINARAAKAGLATTGEAIALTSAVTKGYGDTSAAAVQKASDLAFTAVKLGQTTFPELAASIGKVVPLTKALGVSQEELFAVMGTVTGVTGTASEVSTQLRGVMQSLLAPTKDMTDLLKRQGFESGKAMLSQLGLSKTLEAITKEAERTGQPLQKFISSIEGQTIALALSGSQADVYQEKLKEMLKASGATDAAFKAQTTGIGAAGFAWDQAKVKVEVLAQELADGLAPILSTIVDRVRPLVEVFVKWTRENQKVAATLAVVAAVIGPVLIVVGQLSLVLKPVLFLFTGIGGSVVKLIGFLLAFLNPVTATIAIVVGLVAALRILGGSWENAGMIISNVMDLIADAVITGLRIVGRIIRVFIGWFGAKILDLWEVDWVKAIVSGLSIAGRKVQEFGDWVVRKIKSFFTGDEAGNLEDFIAQVQSDLGQGATTTDLLGTIKQVVAEETAGFRERRANKELLPAEVASRLGGGIASARERLKPIETRVVDTKDRASKEMMEISKGIKELVTISKKELNKPSVELEPVGL